MLLLAGNATALGLGELRGQPVMGERIRLEISLLGGENSHLDAACFRLVQPVGQGDLPWLKRANLSIRKGNPLVLEIRSESLVRDPVMQVGVLLGCGHEVSRDYVIMASPAPTTNLPAEANRSVNGELNSSFRIKPERPEARQPRPVPSNVDLLPPVAHNRTEARKAIPALHDRVMISGGVGDPPLRVSTELTSGVSGIEEHLREILRLEYRMLEAMNQNALSQLSAAEKLRNMEATLGALQERVAEFAQRLETKGSGQREAVQNPINSAIQPSSPPGDNLIATPTSVPKPTGAENAQPDSAWGLYGALLGALLGLAGWLGWKKYVEGKSQNEPVHTPIVVSDPNSIFTNEIERDENIRVDLPIEIASMGMSNHVDVDLDVDVQEPAEILEEASVRGQDSKFSISATALDEHFEVNPVMELADIMLSFGRVKGAAQTLQEFIDNNPHEALQPWIRLMDVYRMAGMRAEFENVARDLNRYFNVEIQSWDDAHALIAVRQPESSGEQVVAPRPQCLEEMPRLMNMVTELWGGGDVVGYLYQLLRDNRGGQRSGFALPVVEDILFLIELKETANRMDVA